MDLRYLHKNTTRILVILAVVVLVVLGLTTGASVFGNRAQAAAPASGSGAPNTPNSSLVTCVISNIAVFSNRIHVHCASVVPSTTISYFAASGDSAHALTTNRFLTLLNTAYALGKPVYLYYLDDPSNNPPGCQSGDCRAIDWLFIAP
jgi:hypothetical protein